MKKGFTLIELLAVIVILAIIALIATPIILEIIKDSKEEARERSIDNIIHTARIYAAKEGLEQNKTVHIKDISDMIDGEKPENGIIYFNENGEVAFSLDFEEEVYVKLFEGEVENENEKYYLKLATTTNGGDQLFFDNTYNIKKEQIEKIITVPTNKVPSNILGSWDVTHNPENKEELEGKVMAWYYDKDSNGLYEVYIGQNGGVKANPDSSKLFNYLTNVTEIDLTYLNTQDVKNMIAMFQRCLNLKSIKGLGNFDTSLVKSMQNMFFQCRKIQDLNLNSFDTSNVENMKSMFSFCLELIELDVSSFNTVNLKDMNFMFGSGIDNNTGERLENMKLQRIIGLEKFDTSNVTDMCGMFQRCVNLTKLDLSNWNTSKVTNMSFMFQGCSNLTELNLSGFDTQNIGNGSSTNLGSMFQMFMNCTNLSTIYVTKTKWVRNKDFDITNMFFNSPAVVKDITTNETIVWS